MLLGMSIAAMKPKRGATYADLEALPSNVKGEIIDGVLYTMPRPRPGHSLAGTRIGTMLDGPFGLGRGGPGGWWILIEPGIQLPNAPEISPDIAGWRRERLARIDPESAITTAPDWVCEVLSPSNRAYDRRVKLPFYARCGVSHVWLVDPQARTVEVKRLVRYGELARYEDLAIAGDDEVVRLEPFDAIEVCLEDLWLDPIEP